MKFVKMVEFEWSQEDMKAARQAMRDAVSATELDQDTQLTVIQMLSFRTSARRQQTPAPLSVPTPTPTVPNSTPAARAQSSGLSRLRKLKADLSQSSISSESSQSSQTTSEVDLEEQRRLEQVADEAAVEAELKDWEDEGIIDDDERLEGFDLVGYWDASVRFLKFAYSAIHSRIPANETSLSLHLQGCVRHPPVPGVSGSLRASIFFQQGNRYAATQSSFPKDDGVPPDSQVSHSLGASETFHGECVGGRRCGVDAGVVAGGG